MLARRPSLAAAAAMSMAAVAVWVSFGTTTFVSVGARSGYVGLLPAAGWLASLLAIAMAVVLVARPPARALLPLWLSAVVVLPWLPLQLPLSVFIWTGTVKLWLWFAIAAAFIGPAIGPTVSTCWRRWKCPEAASCRY